MEELDKVYYKIGEVADMIGEPVSLVRFWSDTYPEYLKPRRNAKGNRLFTPDDIKALRSIHYLVKEKGMTLEGARKAMKGKTEELSTKLEAISRLKAIREILVEIKEEI